MKRPGIAKRVIRAGADGMGRIVRAIGRLATRWRKPPGPEDMTSAFGVFWGRYPGKPYRQPFCPACGADPQPMPLLSYWLERPPGMIGLECPQCGVKWRQMTVAEWERITGRRGGPPRNSSAPQPPVPPTPWRQGG
ncbi:MAG: hypothetical protein ACE5R4_08310 [Armatimonadota bacterium]